MKIPLIFLAGCTLLAGCEMSGNPAALISPDAARRSGESDATLEQGRHLFVTRCIECHALPVVAHHSASEWPVWVGRMSVRSDLKPAEREALTAYLVTLRRTIPGPP